MAAKPKSAIVKHWLKRAKKAFGSDKSEDFVQGEYANSHSCGLEQAMFGQISGSSELDGGRACSARGRRRVFSAADWVAMGSYGGR